MTEQISIQNYDDYKEYVQKRILNMEKRGWGQYKKIAEFLGIGTVDVAQIFKGKRQLTPDQAFLLNDFFQHTQNESDYFLLLVNYERANHHKFKTALKKQIEQRQKESLEIKNKIKHDTIIDEKAKSLFYSQWYYSATRVLTSIESFKTKEAIAKRLNLSPQKVGEVVEFLLANGLLVEKNNKYNVGPQVTHLDSTSPFISKHHTNWRLQALKSLEEMRSSDLHYSAPLTISVEAAKIIRENLMNIITDTISKVRAETPEQLYCLCLDWFEP